MKKTFSIVSLLAFFAFSSPNFSYAIPTITLLAPSGGEKWELGKTYEIRWSFSSDLVANKISILIEASGFARQIVSNYPIENASYSWRVPTTFEIRSDYTATISVDTPYSNYSIAFDKTNSPFSLVASSGPIATPKRDWTKEAHPSGTLINQDGAIYQVYGSGKIGFPSLSVFRSHGHSLSEVVTATLEDRALPMIQIARYRDGDLVSDKGTVYVVYQGKKYGFSSKEIFEALGYKFKNVFLGDLSNYPLDGAISDLNSAHSYGTLINLNGTIFIAHSNGKTGIPSMNVFRSHKYRLDRVVKANSTDTQLKDSGNLGLANGILVNHNGTIYHLDLGEKKPFKSATPFLDMKFKFSQALEVSSSEIAGYRDGEAFE